MIDHAQIRAACDHRRLPQAAPKQIAARAA
jgi:hypothetical protein